MPAIVMSGMVSDRSELALVFFCTEHFCACGSMWVHIRCGWRVSALFSLVCAWQLPCQCISASRVLWCICSYISMWVPFNFAAFSKCLFSWQRCDAVLPRACEVTGIAFDLSVLMNVIWRCSQPVTLCD